MKSEIKLHEKFTWTEEKIGKENVEK